MSDRTYWLSLFNPQSWEEFVAAGANVMGFPETRQKTVRRIRPGDYLLGYMTGLSRWFVVLEVTAEPFDDLTPIWSKALFPCRVEVSMVTQVPPDQGVPALSLSQQLELFDRLNTPNWGLLFRFAPKELSAADGAVIVGAIAAARAATAT